MSDEARPLGHRDTWHYWFIVRHFGPWLLRSLGGFHITGRANVPDSGPALICPNHISYLDPPVVGIAVLKRRCCFMAKSSLFRVPVLGKLIAQWGSYPVDREEGGRQALRLATSLLEAGELVIMFPEGTRSPDGEMLPGEPGAAFIASRVGVPIVPVAVWGTNTVLPRSAHRLFRCPTYVRFGKPIPPPAVPEGGRVSRQEIQALTDELMARIAALRAEILAEVPEKWKLKAERIRARALRHQEVSGDAQGH
jgi:1-acyl-sn-glycerol-3-phosphate acyltransferase